MAVQIKRIYEATDSTDGYRILVDRLWPRGIKKEEAAVDKWLKEIAPSEGLRKWFNHEPEKFHAFTKKYHAEINGSSSLDELLSDIARHKMVTLLYSAKDEKHNQAVALLEFLKK